MIYKSLKKCFKIDNNEIENHKEKIKNYENMNENEFNEMINNLDELTLNKIIKYSEINQNIKNQLFKLILNNHSKLINKKEIHQILNQHEIITLINQLKERITNEI